MIMSLPPINLSPGTIAAGPGAMAIERADLLDFNERITEMLVTFESLNTDVTVFNYRPWNSFITAIEDPAANPITAGFKSTDSYCELYNL